MPNLTPNLEIERCPICGVHRPNLSSAKTFNTNSHTGQNPRFWRFYLCNTCGSFVTAAAPGDGQPVTEQYPSNQNRDEDALQTISYLAGDVAADFKEALSCFEIGCWNAFAAMCRRTVQSISTDKGVQGSSKVEGQLNELKEMGQIDDDTFDVIKQIILSGHDGAHPHLATLNESRAGVLLELMKDVLYQLYVRKKKIELSMQMRTQAIADKKTGDSKA